MLGTWRVSNYTPEYRETSSVGRRKLLTMDEVLRLPQDRELLILRGQKVAMLHKFDYEKHPDAKKLVQSNATDHVPEWRQRYKPIFKEPAAPMEPSGAVPLPEKKSKRPRRPKREETYADSNAEQLSIIPARKEDLLP